LYLQQRDIALVIAADQFGIKFAAIVQLDADFIGLADDVIVGQNIAFCRINNDAGAQAFKRLSLLVGRLIAKIFFQFFRDALALYRGASTCTLTTAGNTFSSIGARLGMAAWPGTWRKGGKYREDAERDNPTLNAKHSTAGFFLHRC
jgi:hypothetical protein